MILKKDAIELNGKIEELSQKINDLNKPIKEALELKNNMFQEIKKVNIEINSLKENQTYFKE